MFCRLCTLQLTMLLGVLMTTDLVAQQPASLAEKSPAEFEELVKGKESSPDELEALADEIEQSGGRGPFGFKSGEMEQSLPMLRLGRHLQSTSTKPPATE